jgi:hypothetical protein
MVWIEYEDGRKASVHEKFMESLPTFRSFYNVWEPGMIQRRHGHHVVFVIKGEITVDGVRCGPGSHIFLMHGDRFGPWVAGPEGAETLGVIAGEGRSFAAAEDEAEFQDILAKAGARRGAVPAPSERDAWDTRDYHLPRVERPG